jgi:uncharacterized protein YggL (DUF469 family)
MKKRLRKKLHRGEFRELGFQLSFDVKVETQEEFDQFFEDFLGRLESAELGYTGTSGESWEGMIAKLASGTITAADRDHVRSFLEQDARVANVEVGDFIDVWQDEW